MTDADRAINVIRRILDDDVNYQVAELKLGGIWSVCQRVAEFIERQELSGSTFVEVKMRPSSTRVSGK